MIDTAGRVKTQPFNGYANHAAKMFLTRDSWNQRFCKGSRPLMTYTPKRSLRRMKRSDSAETFEGFARRRRIKRVS